MKLTKVDKARIAVSREKKDMGRVVLYMNPDDRQKASKTTEQQVYKRIDDANRLYQVFFKSAYPIELRSHFKEIAKIAEKSRDTDDFCEKVSEYKGYEWESKEGNTRFSMLSRFSYNPVGKNLFSVMSNYVQEYMELMWQKEEYRNAAAKMLCCICAGRNFLKELKKVKDVQPCLLDEFVQASKECEGRSFIRYDTSLLENTFTLLMAEMVGKCSRQAYEQGDKEGILQSVQSEIQWLSHVKFAISKNKWGEKKQNLSQIKNPYATEERLQTVLIRMRKSLKRGKNRDIAIALLQGLAQMNGTTFTGTVKKLYREQEKELVAFVEAVNRDYYRINITKSVRNTDVKVQPNLNHDGALALSSLGNSKKEALTDTLLRYAASGKESDQVLLDIKGLLFDYFLPENKKEKERYTTTQNLWNIPYLPNLYFDYGFVATDSDDNHDVSADKDIEKICNADPEYKIPQGALKKRIRYVNFGRYLQMKDKESDRENLYWIQYIKEFVDKNYVDTKRSLSRENCYASSMMMNCWKEIIRYLCGKYIDIGKAVFHFTNLKDMPEPKDKIVYGQVQAQYKNGISSFDYEVIKAEDTLQRNIANAVVSASFAFSRAVVDDEKMDACTEKNKEDILFLSEDTLMSLLRDNCDRQLLRFYGGKSSVAQNEYFIQEELVKEILSHLKSIRNENFHYMAGQKKKTPHKYASILWKNDEAAHQELIRKRYYANNTGLFYEREKIRKLVTDLYTRESITEAQIPAFRTVLKRVHLADYMKELGIPFPSHIGDKMRGSFEDTLYFLMKEIYYRDFITGEEAANYFFDAVRQNETVNGDKRVKQAAKNFLLYVKPLEKKYHNKEISFGTVCQYIMTEYNQQNTGKQETEIYKHFKILLSLCIRKAFGAYIKKKHPFLFAPVYSDLKGEPDYLDDLILTSGVEEKNYEWFTFAHFLHPVQLNHLVGDFKSYIQYREDILRRIVFAEKQEYDGQREEVRQRVAVARDILDVLEFVRSVSGKISNEYTDYYDNNEEYAEFLSQYIDFKKKDGKSTFESLKYFCKNILKGDAIVDLYADAENPKVLRNVELARMYAGSNVRIPEYKKITDDEIQQYYKSKDSVALILSHGLCADEKEQEKVVKFSQNKRRLTLNEITDIYSVINDLLGKLVSFSYLRERDEMYLLLGFYYMALCSENNRTNAPGWKDEVLDHLTIETKKVSVDGGFVLYQIVSAFNFGTKLLYADEKGKWNTAGGAFPGKFGKFGKNHKESLTAALRLFENEAYEREIVYWRDYVDHMKYYVNQDQSIMELYSSFYSKIFGYSTKLRKSVIFNLQAVLEQYHINSACVSLQQSGKCAELRLAGKLKSEKFTFKLKKEEGGKSNKTVVMDALEPSFLEEIKKMLEYKKHKTGL